MKQDIHSEFFERNVTKMLDHNNDQIPEHRRRARRTPYKEVLFFGSKDCSEREANSVAAHVMIDDGRMIEMIIEGWTSQAIAAELYVPEDLLLIAIEDYQSIHPELPLRLPRIGRGNYLKDYEIFD